jgi:hypothetical protein
MILIPSFNMNLPLKDYTRRKHPASGINAFNRCNPFPIAWLNKIGFPGILALITILVFAIKPIAKPVLSKL